MLSLTLSRTTRRLLITTLFLLLVILVTGCSGNTSTAPGVTPAVQVESTLPVVQDASDAITANGIVVPAGQVSLGFQVGGVVEELTVEVGDTVQAGQLLARLDATVLERAVAQAEAARALARAQLVQIQAEPGEEEVVAAESGVAAAEAGLTAARAALTAAQASLAEAERRLADAEDAHQRELDRPWEPQEVRDATWREVLRAQESLDVAQANCSAAQMDVQAAQAQVEQARAQLDKVMAGATDEEITAAQARVDQAQLALEQAQADLAQADLVAPFAGTVTAVTVGEGEIASVGIPILELADTGRWRVETNNVGELEIGRVEVGQETRVTVNTFLGEELAGTVVAISPTAIVQHGDTTYTVIIELEETNLDLRWGMTARVKILVED
jgi:multidrug resistance efflux pump